MGERKVLNRYVPPDFDPKIIPKFKRDKNKTTEVRTMLPFSMRCETCGEYMGRGKKFNSRKEYCQGEDYMKIRRWRFLVKCCVCNAEISFKTDPKSTDYEIEYGAVRNFEVWKDNDAAIEEDEKMREEEDADAMKSLENRTLDSKLEMDVLDTLDEIKAMNQRHERVDTELILRQREQREAQASAGLTEADEALVQSIRFRGGAGQAHSLLSDDEDEEQEQGGSKRKRVDIFHAVQNQLAASKKTAAPAAPSLIRKKKKKKVTADSSATASTASPPASVQTSDCTSNHNDAHGSKKGNADMEKKQQQQQKKVDTKAVQGGGGCVLGGLGGYGSSSSEDE